MSARRLPLLTALLAFWVLASPALALACCLAPVCADPAPSTSARANDSQTPEATTDATATAHCSTAATRAERADTSEDVSAETSTAGSATSATAALLTASLSSTACDWPAVWTLDLRATTPHAPAAAFDAPLLGLVHTPAGDSLPHSRTIPVQDPLASAPAGAAPPLFTLHAALLI